MGYTTEFTGRFLLNKQLDNDTYNFLVKLNKTRRMARNVDVKYGVQGEFFVDGGGCYGQEHDSTIIDYNTPPSTQPGLWCNWMPSEDRMGIEWDEGEKFYNYREWLDYIAINILNPKGYFLSGTVQYQGEDSEDKGEIDGSNPLEIITSVSKKQKAIKDIKEAFEVIRKTSNQYGVPEWKFQLVHDAMAKAENALVYLENN